MKKIWKDYFTFSKRDRIAIIIILLVIILFIFLPQFFGVKKDKPVIDSLLTQQIADARINPSQKPIYPKQEDWETPYQTTENTNSIKGTLFEFDPNTLDAAGWKKLGLRDKTVATIMNYRNKGGRFKSAEDIRKIWGLNKEEADRIIPYANVQSSKFSGNNQDQYSKQPVKNVQQVVDINTATVDQLKSLPGMVYPLQYRIITFRDKLGGFIHTNQVRETYGMTDSVYEAIKPFLTIQSNDIRKININTATEYELNLHPYIDKTTAKAIVIFRTQHGKYSSVDDIKKIVFIKDDVFNKMQPYLTVE